VKAWASTHGFQYNEHGIDLVHQASGLKFEVMVSGAWSDHSGSAFQAAFWRAIIYS
jgi:hypothetical protein